MSDKMTKPLPSIKEIAPEDRDSILQPYCSAFASMIFDISISEFDDYIDNPTKATLDEWFDRREEIHDELVDRMKLAFAKYIHVQIGDLNE